MTSTTYITLKLIDRITGDKRILLVHSINYVLNISVIDHQTGAQLSTRTAMTLADAIAALYDRYAQLRDNHNGYVWDLDELTTRMDATKRPILLEDAPWLDGAEVINAARMVKRTSSLWYAHQVIKRKDAFYAFHYRSYVNDGCTSTTTRFCFTEADAMDHLADWTDARVREGWKTVQNVGPAAALAEAPALAHGSGVNLSPMFL